MAFKMKAGKEGPMKKNFPGAFKRTTSSGVSTKKVSLKTKLMNQIKAIGEGLGEFDRYFAAEKGNATLAGYKAYKKELARLRAKRETEGK